MMLRDGGLVHNKPFSLELRGVFVPSGSPPKVWGAQRLAELKFNLAVKVSQRPMEKRTNVYRPIEAVWVKAVPPAVDVDAGMKTAIALAKANLAHLTGSDTEMDSSPAAPAASSSATPFNSEIVAPPRFKSPSDRSPQHVQCAPTPLSVLRKHEREQVRDRTIGLAPIITSEPAAGAMDTISQRTVTALVGKLHMKITAVMQKGRKGLLEIVHTRGGGCGARPSQRSDKLTRNFLLDDYLLERSPSSCSVVCM